MLINSRYKFDFNQILCNNENYLYFKFVIFQTTIAIVFIYKSLLTNVILDVSINRFWKHRVNHTTDKISKKYPTVARQVLF